MKKILSSKFTALGILFIVLKLTNVISWSWWWVTIPIWGSALVVLAVMTIALIASIWIIVTIKYPHDANNGSTPLTPEDYRRVKRQLRNFFSFMQN